MSSSALREATGALMYPVDRPDYEQAVEVARKELGEEAFAAAGAEGRTMSVEQVIIEVLRKGGRMNGES